MSQPSPAMAAVGRRSLTLLAAVSLIVAIGSEWASVVDSSPGGTVVLVLCWVTVAVLGVLALVATTARVAGRVNLGLLGIGLVVFFVNVRENLWAHPHPYPSDEGRLVQLASDAIAHGHDPYALRWPPLELFAGNTPLMGGGGVTKFDYPPLSAELGAGLSRIWNNLGAPGTLASLGLAATAVLCFLFLPPYWRPLSIIATFGIGPLTSWAITGHPILVALPLLCVAVHRWTAVGAGGRLGLRGIVQASCLGLACATQQLAWFVVPGYLLALWLVRRGELDDRQGALVLVRFAAVGLAAFVLVNLPFMIAHPRAWLGGITAVLTQGAVPGGNAFVAFTMMVRGESGHIEFYSYAAALMMLATLGIIAVGIRKVAVAVPLLLVFVFAMGTRSQDEYFLVFVPMWLVWIFGTDPDAVAAARPLARRSSPLLRSNRRIAVALVAAVLPSLALIGAAIASDGPLAMHVASADLRNGKIQTIMVDVTNRTDATVHPSFYLDPDTHIRSAWRIGTGPVSLAPGQHVTYTLVPGPLGPQSPDDTARVWALSDSPPAVSSAPMSGVPLVPIAAGWP